MLSVEGEKKIGWAEKGYEVPRAAWAVKSPAFISIESKVTKFELTKNPPEWLDPSAFDGSTGDRDPIKTDLSVVEKSKKQGGGIGKQIEKGRGR